MKRLLLVAVMVLVTLVGMVGVRNAAGQNESDVITQLQNIQQTLSAVSYYYTVSELQSTANPTNKAVTELLETVYDLDTVYDLNTVYDWETVYALEKVYAWDSVYDLDTVYDWETVYALEKVYARVPASAKMYYLTVASFTGGDAIKACDPRFHIARISEIQDPSNLQYATRSITVYDSLVDDPGFSPPADRMGWVYTGSLPLAGVPDYSDYNMSSIDQQNGITVAFHVHNIWGDLSMDPFSSDPTTGWQTAQRLLSYPQPVWCVEDPE